MRREPVSLEMRNPHRPNRPPRRENPGDEVRKHEAVVQAACPSARGGSRRALFQNHAISARSSRLLREAHRASAAAFRKPRNSTSPSRPVGLRTVELVDAEFGAVRIACHVTSKIAQHAVDEPGRALARVRAGNCWKAISSSYTLSSAPQSTRGAWLVGPMNMSWKQIRQRRMVLPVCDQALQQIGTAQKRTVRRGRHRRVHVVAAAGAGMPAVEHELLVPRRRVWRAWIVENVGWCSHKSRQFDAGWTLTSITPGSGVTLSAGYADRRRSIAFNTTGIFNSLRRFYYCDQIELVFETGPWAERTHAVCRYGLAR